MPSILPRCVLIPRTLFSPTGSAFESTGDSSGRADDGRGGETESRPPDAALGVTPRRANLCFQRDLHGLGWIPADQGNDGDDTGRPSRHPCVASHHLRHSRASRPRPGDLSPLSRKECRGSTRGRVACSHHSREACPRGSGEQESTQTNESGQSPRKREVVLMLLSGRPGTPLRGGCELRWCRRCSSN